MARSVHVQRINPRGRFVGFTLVELLVVIGIIAVLIGTLLPALGKAREQAKNLQCMANMRSIGQGLYIYSMANKGMLPYGYWSGDPNFNWQTGPGQTDWTLLVTNALNPRLGADYAHADAYNLDVRGARGVLLCPDAIQPTANGLLTHYSSHPRLMPNVDSWDFVFNWDGTRLKTWKLGSIHRPAEVGMIFEGVQRPTQGANGQWGANVTAQELDQGRVNWSNGLVENYPIQGAQYYDAMNWPVDTSVPSSGPDIYWNKDCDQNYNQIRFRHFKNTSGNVLMADGHVESFTAKDKYTTNLLRRNAWVYQANFKAPGS